jgi:hypothetical protein
MDKGLRTLLFLKGHKNEMRRRIVRQHKLKLFGVIFELSGIFYLYRDFVTVLAKITGAVTLLDKFKRELVH